MRKLILAAVCVAATLSPALGDVVPKPGDFYLISRDDIGKFVGSHKLYEKQSRGLHKVSYCGYPFYVRSQTVAWTRLEADRGNWVQIEFNSGYGWRPICGSPEDQVSLEDIGIKMDAEEFMAKANAPASEHKSRLAAIGSGFSRH